VHKQRQQHPPKAEFFIEHIEGKQTDEQHKQDACNTGRPIQDLFEGFISWRHPKVTIARPWINSSAPGWGMDIREQERLDQSRPDRFHRDTYPPQPMRGRETPSARLSWKPVRSIHEYASAC
jgi:hypothetical protein